MVQSKRREMKKQFVSYEIALALKELRFDDFYMFGWYIKDDGSKFAKSLHIIGNGFFYFNPEYCVKAQLWQQVIDWFRTKHKLHITITSQSQESWQWHIQFPHDSLNKMWQEDYYSYEEAREAAILEAIKIVKGN